MLFLLSPAKTLNYDAPLDAAIWTRSTRPAFATQAATLIGVLRDKSATEVGTLMSLSPALAELNHARYQAWRPRFTRHNSRPAALAFDGDVYTGLDARALDLPALDWAQQRLVILSGLYGALRPLDLMQPYRLEMGTRLASADAPDLYRFWGAELSRYLNRRQRGEQAPVVVNLASQEYARAVDRKVLKARVIDCVFEDWGDNGYKVIGFFAKRARGMMARFAIDQRVESVDELRAFDTAGYTYSASESDLDRWVFRRRWAESTA